MLKLPTYRELNTYNVNGYLVTNEEPELVRSMLEGLGRKFKLAGGICSGGEMALLATIPFSERTVLIDHGLNACAAAWYKSALLSVMGARLFRNMIAGGREFELVLRGNRVFERLKKQKLLPSFGTHRALPQGSQDANACLSFPTLQTMRKEYTYTPEAVLRKTRQRLDTLTICHGDFLDMAEFGKFDFLYLSNMFGHSGRNGTPTLAKTVQPLIADGGIVLTTALPAGAASMKGWETIATAMPLRTSWTYTILQYNGQ